MAGNPHSNSKQKPIQNACVGEMADIAAALEGPPREVITLVMKAFSSQHQIQQARCIAARCIAAEQDRFRQTAAVRH